jgi:peptidyl-prolyl cis-trans isomerase D
MLDTLRKGASSLVAKILFALLVISFAIWGIGDIFRGPGRQSAVAQIGDQKITGQMLVTEYNRYLEQLRPMFGGKLDSEQAKKLGFPQAVLQRMAGQAVFDQAAHDLDLAVSDQTLRAKIEDDPAFKGPGGRFDQLTFRQALAQAGFTEEGFVSDLRKDMARQELINSIRGTGVAPKIMVEALYRVQEEKRIADTVAVKDTDVSDPPAPSDEDLAKYHKEHAAAFTAPETRSVTYLALTAKDLAKDIEVTDDELHKAYDEDKGRFSTPELRTVRQIVTGNEADAKKAAAMLAEGKDFAEVAKEVANQDKDAIELGTVPKDQLPKELRETVFALPADGVTPPIPTALGWHILKVTAIKPSSEKSFDEVKDALRDEVAQEKARDKIDGLANQLDDTLASGASLEEAAQKLDLKTEKADGIDAQGRDASGKPVAGLPGGPFLASAFSTLEGKLTSLTEIPNDGYFVLRVDKVTASALRPLADVRDVVISAWRGDERHKAAKARANEIAQKASGGKSLTEIATDYHLEVKTVGPFKRTDTDVLTDELIKSVFAEKVGETALGENKDGYLIAQVRQVIPADPSADKDGVAALQEQLDGNFGTDFMVEYGAAVEGRYPIKVNTKAFDALFASGS